MANRTTLSHLLHRNEKFSRNFYLKKRTASRTRYTQIKLYTIFSGNLFILLAHFVSTSPSGILGIFGRMQSTPVMAGLGKQLKEKIINLLAPRSKKKLCKVNRGFISLPTRRTFPLEFELWNLTERSNLSTFRSDDIGGRRNYYVKM